MSECRFPGCRAKLSRQAKTGLCKDHVHKPPYCSCLQCTENATNLHEAVERQVVEAVIDINSKLLDASRQNIMRKMTGFSEDQCYAAVARAVAKGYLKYSEKQTDGIRLLSATECGFDAVGQVDNSLKMWAV